MVRDPLMAARLQLAEGAPLGDVQPAAKLAMMRLVNDQLPPALLQQASRFLGESDVAKSCDSGQVPVNSWYCDPIALGGTQRLIALPWTSVLGPRLPRICATSWGHNLELQTVFGASGVTVESPKITTGDELLS